jgi:hypothetical protein
MMNTHVLEAWFNDTSTPLERRTCGMLCLVLGGAALIAGVFATLG